MQLILRILFSALGLLLIAEFVPGITVNGLYPAIIAALILGILNAFVRPVLFILTLPITILTLGLFSFVINAALFLFVASFIDGFAVEGFWYALLGSILMSIISTIGSKFIAAST
jgi:putative membrane protein